MTKDLVLKILNESNDYISGTEISRKLSVSRAAINMAVNSLREDGYTIYSITNKGYKLVGKPNILSKNELSNYLPQSIISNVLCLDVCDSTNIKARELAFSGAKNRFVVTAEGQTAGKGRLGRSFVSTHGKGVFLSMIVRPDMYAADTTTITAWTAVAVCKALETITGLNFNIKWVNDILLNNKKICGILTEMSVEFESNKVQNIIIGIGVNINNTRKDFPTELGNIASSLLLEQGHEYNRAEVCAEIIKELNIMLDKWPDINNTYLSEYKARCVNIGKQITIKSPQQELHGIVNSINDDFSLNITFSDGSTRDISTGEVIIDDLYKGDNK